jgi:replication-associated recombination protein RarA
MSTQIEITELYEWAEKYRPKSLDLVILKEEVKSLFETYIERKSIPNLLFYGPPGGGKSTVGRILVNN